MYSRGAHQTILQASCGRDPPVQEPGCKDQSRGASIIVWGVNFLVPVSDYESENLHVSENWNNEIGLYGEEFEFWFI
jgi:hypothetical protein